MRHLGSLEDETLALRFHDYMLARGMPTKVDREGHEWAVWIIEEDHAVEAREELESFLAAPDDAKYLEAAKSAQHIRRDLAAKEKQARKQQRNVGREWDARRRRGPIVTVWLTVACVVVTMFAVDWSDPLVGGSLFGSFNLEYTPVLRAAFILPPTARGGWLVHGPTLLDVLSHGQVWRIFTPMFIHFGPIHLLFNLMMFRQFGSAVEMRRGSWRYLALVLVIAAVSNVIQYAWSGPAFGGMSGVVYGLFGYVWIKSRYDPRDGFHVPPNMVFIMLAWLVICYTGGVGHIANAAHTAGLAMGCVLGYLPVYLRSQRP